MPDPMRILGKNKVIKTTHSKPFGNDLIQFHFKHLREEYFHSLNILNLSQPIKSFIRDFSNSAIAPIIVNNIRTDD